MSSALPPRGSRDRDPGIGAVAHDAESADDERAIGAHRVHRGIGLDVVHQVGVVGGGVVAGQLDHSRAQLLVVIEERRHAIDDRAEAWSKTMDDLGFRLNRLELGMGDLRAALGQGGRPPAGRGQGDMK